MLIYFLLFKIAVSPDYLSKYLLLLLFCFELLVSFHWLISSFNWERDFSRTMFFYCYYYYYNHNSNVMGILILNESGLKFLLFVFLFSQNINPARERKKEEIPRHLYKYIYTCIFNYCNCFNFFFSSSISIV